MSEASYPEGTSDYSIGVARANLLGVPLFLIMFALVLLPFEIIWGWNVLVIAIVHASTLTVGVPLLIGGVIGHEALHGIGWMHFGKTPMSAIRFGFHWKTITPFAHCTLPIKASAYRAGAALPGIVLGILPAAVGLTLGIGIVALFGAFFLAAASGDALSLWIMRSVPADAEVIDHPTRVGCLVLPDYLPNR